MEAEEEQFFSPRNDYLFKRIFGSEQTKDPLISLLRAILRVNITDVEIKNPELLRFSDDDKQGILDVRAVINGKEHVNVEIQVYYQTYYMKRTQFYLAKLYDTQLKEGQTYADLQRAIVINILCGDKFKLPADQWHNIYILKEKTHHTPMYDGMLELHFIELDKMEKLGDFDESNELIKWVMFMNAESMQDMKTVAKQNPAICKAYSIVEELAKNKQERQAYEARQKFLLDQLTRERSAEEEGIKKGRIEGRKEGKIEDAKAMLARGIDIDIICEVTGLDIRDFKDE